MKLFFPNSELIELEYGPNPRLASLTVNSGGQVNESEIKAAVDNIAAGVEAIRATLATAEESIYD